MKIMKRLATPSFDIHIISLINMPHLSFSTYLTAIFNLDYNLIQVIYVL